LEDCFEGIICFETLNQPFSATESSKGTQQIFDIVGHFSRPEPGVELPKTPVLCKPSIEAMDYALKIANANPQRAVRMHCLSALY
jgi:putative hydrolase of the HAD superfamily